MIIIVPRGAEAAAVRRAKPAARIVEIAAGAGAARSLPDDLGRGEPIVVLGLCGALGDLRVGDVAVYDGIAGVRNAGDDGDWRTAGEAGALRAMVDGRFVRACTTDHVVTTVAERTALAALHRADVVDMEGASLAIELTRRGLHCAMLRVVSDDGERDLPAMDGVIAADGRLRAQRLARSFLRSPRSAIAFVRNARRALRRLEAVARTIAGAATAHDDGRSLTNSA